MGKGDEHPAYSPLRNSDTLTDTFVRRAVQLHRRPRPTVVNVHVRTDDVNHHPQPADNNTGSSLSPVHDFLSVS